jgi:ATP-dependent helicase HrpA
LAEPVRAAVATASGLERAGLRDWPDDLDVLPRTVEQQRAGHLVRGHPAFVDAGDSVTLRVFATEAEQRNAMPGGTRRLLRLALPSPVRAVQGSLTTRARLVGVPGVLDDCADAAVDDLVRRNGGVAWDRASFAALADAVRAQLGQATVEVAKAVERVLAAANDVRSALPANPTAAQAEAVGDMRAQLAALLPPAFVTSTGRARLADLARYVAAIGRRLEKLPREIEVDRARMSRVHQMQAAYRDLVAALPAARSAAEDVQDIRWLIEELRVSLFAQQLGTARPVSEQRIYRAIDAISP